MPLQYWMKSAEISDSKINLCPNMAGMTKQVIMPLGGIYHRPGVIFAGLHEYKFVW